MVMRMLIGICSSHLKKALVKEQCRLDVRKYFFSQKVINEWHKLPNVCVNASEYV